MLTKLFEPIRLGPLEISNRIIMPAITTQYDLEEGDRIEQFYAERARGGVGLLIIGALKVLYPSRRIGRGRLNLYEDHCVPRLKALTKAIHDNGGKCAAQLSLYGYWAQKGRESTAEDVGPSEVCLPVQGLLAESSQLEFPPRIRPLTIDEIHQIEEAIGGAARRAREAGFDAIELQVVGGNLLVRFINPFTNQRTDEYGGCLENRLRIIIEGICQIKKKVGDDFPLICRIPGEDMVPWGLHLEDWIKIACLLETKGVHAFNLRPGWHETREPIDQMSVPRGAFIHLAAGMKRNIHIPVAIGGRINDPLMAEEILKKDMADMIAMGRPLIADPDLPNKARKGRFEDIRLCTACCHCWNTLLKGEPIECSVNARAGREKEFSITPTDRLKKITVVGGGPSGMEAARIAALRGHQVTLYEKKGELGGQLLYAILPPYKEEWKSLIQYLTRQLQMLKVDIRLNETCDAKILEGSLPDAVVIATGALPIIPDLPGVEADHVISAIDVLAGNRETGQQVVIVGGGLVGCEVAEFLFKKAKKVIILEMLDRIGMDLGAWNRWVVMDRLNATGIRVETRSKVVEITKKGVRVLRPGGFDEFFEADTVVLATGTKPNNDINDSIRSKIKEVYSIGDCITLNQVHGSIKSGFMIGFKI